MEQHCLISSLDSIADYTGLCLCRTTDVRCRQCQCIQINSMVSIFHLMKTVLKTCFDYFCCIIVLALNSFSLLGHG